MPYTMTSIPTHTVAIASGTQGCCCIVSCTLHILAASRARVESEWDRKGMSEREWQTRRPGRNSDHNAERAQSEAVTYRSNERTPSLSVSFGGDGRCLLLGCSS
jgi:hypothetical protein